MNPREDRLFVCGVAAHSALLLQKPLHNAARKNLTAKLAVGCALLNFLRYNWLHDAARKNLTAKLAVGLCASNLSSS
jgi:hypothetical protein